MTALAPAFAGVVALAAPIGVVVALQPHLSRAFAEFCGARHRGDFWVRVVDAAVLIGAPASALIAVPLGGSGDFHLAVSLLRGTLAGLVGAMLAVIGIALVYSARMAAGVMPPPVLVPGPTP